MSEKKIRVLHVGLDTRLGGIETYLLKISSNVNREVFEFSFLAYDDEKPCFYDELTAMGCRFYFIRSRRASFFGDRRDLRELYKREKFDIVHFHLNSLTYITPITEALKCGIKVIAHSRNAGASSGSSSRILCAFNRVIFPYSKVTLAAVSDKAGKWMFGERRKITILNNGIDTSLYRYCEDKRTALRKELDIEGREVIIHVGAFREQKNHKFLIAVFDDYHKSHEDAILLLAGEGELMDEIREDVERCGLSSSVIFLGRRSDTPSLLSCADKFLFPSLYEGFPNALIEAETAGLFCVVSDTITKQACLDNAFPVSLTAPIAEWSDVLSKPSLLNRERYADIVEEKGFGIKSEMERLEKLYYNQCGRNNG